MSRFPIFRKYTIVFLFLSFSETCLHAANRGISLKIDLVAISSSADTLTTQIAVDRLIDPSVDAQTTSATIDRLTLAAKQFAGPNPDDNHKFAAIRKVIYEAGPWNDNRPFSYDHADPLGSNYHNKLLSTYVKTRLGNCVSMPTLFLIIAERLGLNVAFSTAPLHVFIIYTTPKGTRVNVEATNGGHFERPTRYQETTPMSDRAIASGLYMRRLSHEEGVALQASTVVDALIAQGKYQEAVEVADVILKHLSLIHI